MVMSIVMFGANDDVSVFVNVNANVIDMML